MRLFARVPLLTARVDRKQADRAVVVRLGVCAQDKDGREPNAHLRRGAALHMCSCGRSLLADVPDHLSRSSQDLSSNGIKINDSLLKTKSAILLQGDIISIRGVAQDFVVCLPSQAHSPPSSSPPSSPDPTSALASRVSLSLSLGAPRPPADVQPPPTLKVGQYLVREDVVLGAGSFGVVRLGWDADGRQVACKSVVKARVRPLLLSQFSLHKKNCFAEAVCPSPFSLRLRRMSADSATKSF